MERNRNLFFMVLDRVLAYNPENAANTHEPLHLIILSRHSIHQLCGGMPDSAYRH